MSGVLRTSLLSFYCTLHEGEKYRGYCRDCKEPICVKCAFKKHNGHGMIEIEDLLLEHYAEAMTRIEAARKDLDDVKYMLRNKISAEEKQIRKLEKERRTQNMTIHKGKLAEMKEAFTTNSRSYLGKLQKRLQNCEDSAEECEPKEEQHRKMFLVLNEELIVSKLTAAAISGMCVMDESGKQLVDIASQTNHFPTNLLDDDIENSNTCARMKPVKDKENVSKLTDEQNRAGIVPERRSEVENSIIVYDDELMNERLREQENEIDDLKAIIRDLQQQNEEKCSFLKDTARSLLAAADQPTNSAYSSVENLSAFRQVTEKRCQLDGSGAEKTVEGQDVDDSQSSSYLEINGWHGSQRKKDGSAISNGVCDQYTDI